jgi:hypothetical protein
MTFKSFLMALVSWLICSTLLTHDTATASGSLVAPVSYDWWRATTPDRRLDAVGAAIQGIRVGWVFGIDADRGDVQANLNEAKATPMEMDVAMRPRRHGIPTFSKPLKMYMSLIDSTYASNPAMRNQPVPLVLLCFSDVKIVDCRNAPGIPSR